MKRMKIEFLEFFPSFFTTTLFGFVDDDGDGGFACARARQTRVWYFYPCIVAFAGS